MCGIIGIVGAKEAAAPALVEALKRLEYRGYDSAGVATLENGMIERRRAAGRIAALEAELAAAPLAGHTGIGHTRWATHGRPTVDNAHPHANARTAVVHNGIIENFREIRDMLLAKGHVFTSETDSETIAHLVADYLAGGFDPAAAVRAAIGRMRGAYAVAFLFAGEPRLMIGARRGSPLVVGLGEETLYLGSDAIALAPFTNRIIYLEEGDIAVLADGAATITDSEGVPVNRAVQIVATAAAAEKGNYRHFMQKEIFEQPEVIGRAIAHYIDPLAEQIAIEGLDEAGLATAHSLSLVACGTAYYAGRVGEYWLEQIARIPVECDIASEFRYREPALAEPSAALFISQSGETADTLAALRFARERGQKVAAILNVAHSSMWREADLVLPILAGPEIGVASTKAFSAQLTVLAALTLALAAARRAQTPTRIQALAHDLLETPRRVAEALVAEPAIIAIAQDLARATGALFLGRGPYYPLALEGALKLKEISYIHAEGYAAGELKHGPIAMVDETLPTIVIAPTDALFEKTRSNIEEVAARGGKIILISDPRGHEATANMDLRRIVTPECPEFIAPIVAAIAIQLIAYHTAVAKGTDVDQPRNLAKSVTVE